MHCVEKQSYFSQQTPRPLLQQTLTGANTIPLPQRPPKDTNGRNKSSKAQKPPLLPTPYDPFLPSYIREAQNLDEAQDNDTLQHSNYNNTETTKKGNINNNKPGPKTNHKIVAEAVVAPRHSKQDLAMSLPLPTHPNSNENPQHNKSYHENRKSMDPDQFRSTMETFQNLAAATAATAQKSHFSGNTNSSKINSTEIPKESIKFDIGTGGEITPEPKTKHRQTFKHKTPPSSNNTNLHKNQESNSDPDDPLPLDSQDSQEDEDMDEDEDDEDVDIIGSLPNISPPVQPRRQLRSNSNSTDL